MLAPFWVLIFRRMVCSLVLYLFAANLVKRSQRAHPSRWQHGQGATKSSATHTPGVLVTRSEQNKRVASERNIEHRKDDKETFTPSLLFAIEAKVWQKRMWTLWELNPRPFTSTQKNAKRLKLTVRKGTEQRCVEWGLTNHTPRLRDVSWV